jgi:hypothetical protein
MRQEEFDFRRCLPQIFAQTLLQPERQCHSLPEIH